MPNTLTSINIPNQTLQGNQTTSAQQSSILSQPQYTVGTGGTSSSIWTTTPNNITWPSGTTWYTQQQATVPGSSYVYVENIGSLQVRRAEGGWIVVKEGKEYVCACKEDVLALL